MSIYTYTGTADERSKQARNNMLNSGIEEVPSIAIADDQAVRDAILAEAAAALSGVADFQQVQINQGTRTTQQAGLVHTVTWNNAGVAFIGQTIDITSTASDAASLIARWRVDGSTMFSVSKAGAVVAAGGWTSAAGKIGLGATPPTEGAINIAKGTHPVAVVIGSTTTGTGGIVNIDGGTSGTPFTVYNGATLLWNQYVTGDGNTVASVAASGVRLTLGANNIVKWDVVNEAAGTASLASREATARVVGGATNGLAIRNNANTRDNFRVFDDGSTAEMRNGAYIGGVYLGLLGGAARDGFWLSTPSTNLDVGLATGNFAGNVVRIAYHNNTTYLTALAVARVASGFSALDLMPAGGQVRIGDAGTFGAGVASLRLQGLTNGAGESVGTLNNAPAVGNPRFWAPIDFGGAIGVGYVPVW